MIIAFKAFNKDLSCRGKAYSMNDWNYETGIAGCVSNGIHCAANPLDCLKYYSEASNRRIFRVICDGDIDEDAVDSKIACTKMKILEELDTEKLVFYACKYVYEHPRLYTSEYISMDVFEWMNDEVPKNGFGIVRGAEPKARASLGTVIGIIRNDASGNVDAINIFKVGENGFNPGVFYDVDGNEVRV